MDPWCAYLLFAQQQEAAQAPMRQRLQELVAPSAAAPFAASVAAPSPASAQQPTNRARRAPPPPTSIPGSGRIIRM